MDDCIERTNSKVKAILSIHTHNDRWCAVAASEMAMQAGWKRVEWCLLWNGERTWNVDTIILALNLFTHGISPNLDLREIYNRVRRVSEIIWMPINPRHPYIWELAYTAFSWWHQDAIKKWFDEQIRKEEEEWFLKWIVPYLPIDPKDVWGIYEAIIQLNSQSWKWWAAYILEKAWYVIPKKMQKYAWAVIQNEAEKTWKDIDSKKAKELFEDKYVNKEWKIMYNEFDFVEIRQSAKSNNIWATSELCKEISDKYWLDIDIKDLEVDPDKSWKNANAISYVIIEINWKEYFWVWIDMDVGNSALIWVISTINIALRDQK